jgi:hypothetical protein
VHTLLAVFGLLILEKKRGVRQAAAKEVVVVRMTGILVHG